MADPDSDSFLPAYSTLVGRLPRYSNVFHDRPATPSSTFQLTNGKGKAWVSLILRNNRRLTKNVPKFVEGDYVTGSVELNLDNPESIQAIGLVVKGRAITGANEGGTFTFLSHSTTLWSKDQGDPRVGDNLSSSRFNGKLLGDYDFPFSFPVPVMMTSQKGSDTHRVALPQSFQERASGVRVQYELVLRIYRGKLRTDQKQVLHVPFIYVPTTTPAPFSELRQLAYRNNTAIPGPDDDPWGWYTLPAATTLGSILNSRSTMLRCTLSLANPLSYTRGSVIPCRLLVESVDEQALDLLVSPKTTVIKLRRCLKYLHDAGQGLQHNMQSRASTPKYECSDVSEAVLWPINQRSSDESRVRQLEGEIHLPKDLPPSFESVPFTVEYTVVLLPFESVTYSPLENKPLGTQRVDIATEYPEGPLPRAFSNAQERRLRGTESTSLEATIRSTVDNPFQLVGT